MHMYFSFSVVFISFFFAETGEATAGVCEPIVANTCRGSGIFHRYTSTPIEVPYGPGSEDHDYFLTQRDAVRKFRQYQPLMKSGRGCHEFLRPLICAVFLPSCDEFSEETAIPPCRDLCEMALTKCARGLRHRGLDWPPQLDCARFPAATENNMCISALRLGVPSVFREEGQVEVQVGCTSGLLPELQLRWLSPDGLEIPENETNRVFASWTDKHTLTLTIRQYTDSSDGGNYTCFIGNKDFSRKIPLDYIHEQPTDPGSCEPIQDSSFCKNRVGYTHTRLPNAFGMFSQSEVHVMLQRFEPVAMTDCSPYLGTLLCGLVLPRCNASSTNKFRVCREVCLRVQADCTEVFEATGVAPLPCEDLESEAEGDCYNGVEIGPVSVVDALDSATAKRVEVECRHAANFSPAWITPTATLTKSSVAPQTDHIEVAPSDDGTVFRLIIHNFIDSRDAGIYTCSDGDTYSRSVTIDNIYQPSREVEIGDLRIVGSDYSIDCTYNLHPALQPKWLSPRGREISTDPSSRIRVVHTEATLTTLYIGDFQSTTDGGLYSCFGEDFNSGQTVLVDSQEIHVNVTEGPVDQPSCEKIRIPACSVGIGYSSTYVPNLIAHTQNDVVYFFDALESTFQTPCSSYLRPYMCSIFLPPCREQAVQPCQELCTKALHPCEETLKKYIPHAAVDRMIESCTNLPSSEDASSQCHNVLELEIGEPQIVGLDYAVDCTYNLLPSLQPTWLSAGGEEISTDSSFRIRVVHTSESVTTLHFEDFHRVVDGGRYSCFGQYLASAETIVIGDLGENTPLPIVEVPEPSASSCEEIRVPACTVGIGYSSTYVPSLVGLSQDQLGSVFNGLDVIFDQPCSSYFRPYMCALYVPPCRERAVLPCQELCITAVEQCAATLGNLFSAGELASMRESCTSMPSETDPNSECHNVEELVLGDVKVDRSDYSVECTYNLLPAIQPKWRYPDGRDVPAAFWTRVHKVQVSDAVTRLLINDFSPASDSGTYTCVAGEHSITVDL